MMKFLQSLTGLAFFGGLVFALPGSFDSSPRTLHARAGCGPRPIIDCQQFSRTGNNPDQHLCCREYIRGSFPKTIAGKRVDLYRYTDGWEDGDVDAKFAHLDDISDALDLVIPDYESYGTDFDVVIIFSENLVDEHDKLIYGYEQEKDGQTSPCYVRIANKLPPTFKGTDYDTSYKQTAAHELYHCVQDANRAARLPADDYNGWWLEGTAEFYDLDYYPSHEDSSQPRKYDPSVPMYMQAYTVSDFFIWAKANGWSYANINELNFNEPQATSYGDARKSMSGNSDIAMDFPRFAQAFADNLIEFSDHSLVEQEISLFPLHADPLPLPEGGSNNWIVKAQTFTIYAFALALDSGQSFTITWAPGDQQATSLFYRQASDTEWIDITTSPVNIELSCDDGTTIYDFLFTCTDNIDTAAGILQFVQTDKQQCCSETATAASCSTAPPAAITASLPPAVSISSTTTTSSSSSSATTTTSSSSSSSTSPAPSTPTSGTIDSCLRGTWNMDLAAMQSVIEQSLSNLPAGETVSNIKVTGSASFAIPNTGSTGTFTFSHTDINYDIATDEFTGHTLIDVDGTSAGTVDMQGSGSFVLTNPVSNGMVKTTTTTSITTDPIEVNFDISEQYGDNVAISYVCTSSTLVMNGVQAATLDGVAAGTKLWSYSFTK